MRAKTAIKHTLRSGINFLTYGTLAPKVGDVLHINPRQIQYRCRKRFAIAEVVASDDILWEEECVESLPVYKEVRQRILEKKSWEEIGSYERIMKLVEANGSQDGCRNLHDVVKRYEAIDQLIEALKMGEPLKTNKELGRDIGEDDIKVHVGPTGEVFKACGGGMHRFSIARILGLPSVPALVCSVHESAVLRGEYRKLRQNLRENPWVEQFKPQNQ